MPSHLGFWKCAEPYRCSHHARALLIDGAARRAGIVDRDDWSSERLPLTGLPSANQASQGSWPSRCSSARAVEDSAVRFWQEAGALEHASIGSFARFALQLLALGAPAVLLEKTHAAALDEVVHARLAFGVAAALGGEAYGPGPLPEATASIPTDMAAVVSALVHEGCVGETVGALEAAAQLEGAEGRARSALDRIAPDEARHAELAWQALKWIISVYGDAARTVARAAVEEASHLVETSPVPSGLAGPRHGVLGSDMIQSIRIAAIRDVVLPVADAMLWARGPGTGGEVSSLAL